MEFFALILLLVADFLLTSLGVWLLTLICGLLSIPLVFSWTLAFGVWAAIKIIKLIV